MTGRGLGRCSGSGSPGYANPAPRRGGGRGYGRGRRFFQTETQPLAAGDEKELLEAELEAIKKRLKELD